MISHSSNTFNVNQSRRCRTNTSRRGFTGGSNPRDGGVPVAATLAAEAAVGDIKLKKGHKSIIKTRQNINLGKMS